MSFSTADAASANLENWQNIFECRLEYFQRILASLCADCLECIVNNALSNTFLTGKHYFINELCNRLIVIHRIRQNITLRYRTFSWH